MLVGNDASIIRGESVEADDDYEEVVTGGVSVSEGGRVVEQGVQGQGQPIDVQGWNNRQRSAGVS